MKKMRKRTLRWATLALAVLCVVPVLSGCTLNTKMGYIDKEGNTVVPGMCQMLQPFHEGLAGIMLGQDDQKYWGFIDKDSMLVVNLSLDAVRPFYEGVAPVQRKNENYWVYINTKGQQAFEGEFADASVFVDGLAPVASLDSGMYGYIDREGKLVLDYQFDLASVFSATDGLAMIRVGGENMGRCGYIDREGKTVIEPKYYYAGTFSDGLAVAKLSSDMEAADYGMIDTTGEMVLGGDFVECSHYAEGLFPAAVKKDDKTLWGYMDREGSWVIEPKYLYALSFSEGVAGVQSAENSLWGYIDATGAWVIEPIYDGASDFSEGLAGVHGGNLVVGK